MYESHLGWSSKRTKQNKTKITFLSGYWGGIIKNLNN